MKLIFKILFYISIIVYANANIDSLEYQLLNAEDKDKVDILNKLARIYFDQSLSQSLNYCKKANELAKKIGYKKGEVKSLINIGKIVKNQGNFTEALKIYEKSLKLSKEINDCIGTAYSFSHMGNIYFRLNNYEKAIDNLKKALEIFDMIHELELTIYSLHSIGSAYYNLGDFDIAILYYSRSLELSRAYGDNRIIARSLYYLGYLYTALCQYDIALEYTLKSLKINEKIDDKYNVAMALHNIATIYFDLKNYKKALDYNKKALILKQEIGDKFIIASSLTSIGSTYYYLSDFNNALNYYSKGLELEKEINHEPGIAMSVNNIGNIYFQYKEYKKALTNYLNSFNIVKKIDDKWGIAKISNNIGKVYLKLNYFEDAYIYLNKGLLYAKKIKAKDLIQNSYFLLSQYFYEIGNHKIAYHYLKLFSDLRDSVFTESSHRIAEMQMRYETDKREKENEILKRKNFIQNLELEKQSLIKWRLYSGLVIVSILVFFVYYLYRAKIKINKELRKKIRAAIKKDKEQQQIIFHQASLTSLGELAAGLAHEINQPLQNIYLANETLALELKEKYPDYSIIRMNVNDISNNLIRLRNIIDHIKIFASKQKDEIFTNFNVNDFIGKALLLIEKQYLKKGIKIDLKTSDDVILLTGNPYKYEQIILNLLSNARDAVLAKSNILINNPTMNIKIEIYKNNKEIITIVEDNGIGILTDKYSEVFTPFYTTKKLGEGSGLGMSITKNIVKEMRGSIKIVSKKNQGTRIIIKLPYN